MNNKPVIGRALHILLGVALLVQSGQACACAYEHLFLCGGGGGGGGATEVATPGFSNPDGYGAAGHDSAPCQRHSRHQTECSAHPLEPVTSGGSSLGAVMLDSSFLAIPPCSANARDRVLNADTPDLPVTLGRSLPLLT